MDKKPSLWRGWVDSSPTTSGPSGGLVVVGVDVVVGLDVVVGRVIVDVVVSESSDG
jgi:hypothetical protein